MNNAWAGRRNWPCMNNTWDGNEAGVAWSVRWANGSLCRWLRMDSERTLVFGGKMERSYRAIKAPYLIWICCWIICAVFPRIRSFQGKITSSPVFLLSTLSTLFHWGFCVLEVRWPRWPFHASLNPLRFRHCWGLWCASLGEHTMKCNTMQYKTVMKIGLSEKLTNHFVLIVSSFCYAWRN